MSSAAAALPRSGPAPGAPRSPWLYGRAADVLLGYGLAYVLSIPLLVWLARAYPDVPLLLLATPFLALAFSTPHYGATLVRVYEQRQDRRKYALFAVWITLAMVVLFGCGLYSAAVGSLLLTAYVSWSPWHFSGQNYGVSVMYLRRRGIPLDDDTKRRLYVSYICSAALAIVSVHLAGSVLSFAAGSSDPTGTFRVLQLGIPYGLGMGIAALAGATYLYCLGSVALRLRRNGAAWGALAPLALLVGVQALWFTFPALARTTNVFPWSGLAFSAIWLSVAHSTQYLWVSCYYVERSESPTSPRRFLAKSLLAGAALSFPALLLAPGLWGGAFPNAAAVGVLIFSAVNLHHFLLDGAIWKLRDGRVARALLRSEAASPAPVATSGWPWLRMALLGIGALTVAIQLGVAWVGRIAVSPDADLERQQSALVVLGALGKDTPDLWGRLGNRYEEAGESQAAIAAYRHAVAMQRQPAPWIANHLAWLLLARPDQPKAVAEATRLARYLARTLGESRPEGLQTLAAAHAAAGRYGRASRAAERALEVARATDDTERAAVIQAALDRYRAAALHEAAPAGASAP